MRSYKCFADKLKLCISGLSHPNGWIDAPSDSVRPFRVPGLFHPFTINNLATMGPFALIVVSGASHPPSKDERTGERFRYERSLVTPELTRLLTGDNCCRTDGPKLWVDCEHERLSKFKSVWLDLLVFELAHLKLILGRSPQHGPEFWSWMVICWKFISDYSLAEDGKTTHSIPRRPNPNTAGSLARALRPRLAPSTEAPAQRQCDILQHRAEPGVDP